MPEEAGGLAMPEITVRPAGEADFTALTQLDLSYTAGERFLALERSGSAPELTFALRWQTGEPRERIYAELTEEALRRALTGGADLFLVAELDGTIAGYLMVVLPRWTDAGEVTDFAVHRPARRHGVGRALLESAVVWARERNLRALWVEPQGETREGIEFYLRLGFRVAGINDRWASNRDDEPGRQTVYMYLDLR